MLDPSCPRVFSTENLRHSKISDLQVSIKSHQQVLRFQVPVSNATIMQIRDTAEQLFEATELLGFTHEAPFNQAKQVAPSTVFHDMAPPVRIADAKILGNHNIRMIQTLGDAIFRIDLLQIFFARLGFSSLSELLDSIQAAAGSLNLVHNLDYGRHSFTALLASPRNMAVTSIFGLKRDNRNIHLRHFRAHATGLGSRASHCWVGDSGARNLVERCCTVGSRFS
jgi:hypothetical protein